MLQWQRSSYRVTAGQRFDEIAYVGLLALADETSC
jgi:hypothetical protein